MTTTEKIERITVIDFETASSAFFSACALGIVVLHGREMFHGSAFCYRRSVTLATVSLFGENVIKELFAGAYTVQKKNM